MTKRNHIHRCLLCRREIVQPPTGRPRKFCDDGGVCKQAHHEARRRLARRYPAIHRQASLIAFIDPTARDPMLDRALAMEIAAARAYRLGNRIRRREARVEIGRFADKLNARETALGGSRGQ